MISEELLHTVIGQRLKAERKRLNMTQREAATGSFTSPEHWGRCERGLVLMGTKILCHFAAQGADVQFILTGKATLSISEDERAFLMRYRASTQVMRKEASGHLTMYHPLPSLKRA